MSPAATVGDPPILAKLNRVEKTKSGWSTLCPAHDDREPSLSVSIGDNGHTLLHCFRGCTFDEICAAAGINPSETMPATNGKPRDDSRAKLDRSDATPCVLLLYARGKDGVTVQGLLLAGVEAGRYPANAPAEKANHVLCFGMFRLGSAGKDPVGWHIIASNPRLQIRKYQGESKPPKLIKSMSVGSTGIMGAAGLGRLDQAKIVYFCEGVSDLLALQSILPADGPSVCVGLPGASCRLRAGESQHFTGKECRIVYDTDDAGKKGAAHLAADLSPFADVRIVELPPRDAGTKNDLRAHLAATRWTHEELDTFSRTFETIKAVDGPRPGGDELESRDPNDPDMREPEGRTDTANGRRLVLRHGKDFRWIDPWSKWLVWNSQRWMADTVCQVESLAKSIGRGLFAETAAAGDEGEDEKLVQEMARFSKATSNVLGCRNAMIAARSEIGIAVQPDQFDADPWLLNVLNGTIDLRTGVLRPHCRENFLTKLAPVEFLPANEAECPNWEAFVDGIFDGNQSLVGFLRRLLGYCLTGDVREQILPILWGNGANGKSTLLNALLDALGDYAMKAPPDLLMVRHADAHPTERADLFGKRLVVANETEDGRRLAESLIKDLSGGDRVRARRMREDFWEFSPQHKILLATNHKPEVRGNDHAIWRRLALVPFNVTFWDQAKGETGAANRQMDKSLPWKLKAEASGILGWCVRGCLEWQRNGLDVPDDVRAATAGYREQEDVLGTFIAKCCALDARACVGATELYRAFQDFTGNRETSQRKFGAMLAERGLTSDRFTGGRNKGRMGWWGIGLLIATDDAGEPSE